MPAPTTARSPPDTLILVAAEWPVALGVAELLLLVVSLLEVDVALLVWLALLLTFVWVLFTLEDSDALELVLSLELELAVVLELAAVLELAVVLALALLDAAALLALLDVELATAGAEEVFGESMENWPE
jgi:hypothetical protein